jgi:hypothetical protein
VRRYLFDPAGMDRWDQRASHPPTGTLVVKTQPHGCPPNGTMGHCFIADAEDPGRFYGLVLENSLQRVSHGPLTACRVCPGPSAVLLRLSPRTPWMPYCDHCADLIAGLGPQTRPLPPGHEPQEAPAPNHAGPRRPP